MVQRFRTVSNYHVTLGIGLVGEVHVMVRRIRTFSNNSVTLRTRLVGEVHMSSECFNTPKSFRTTV